MSQRAIYSSRADWPKCTATWLWALGPKALLCVGVTVPLVASQAVAVEGMTAAQQHLILQPKHLPADGAICEQVAPALRHLMHLP